MPEPKRLNVMVLDDGELDDVQNLLEEIGAEFGRVRGGAIVPGTPPPIRLLVSTPRRIEAVRPFQPDLDGEEEPVRIVVAEGDSTALRAKLREIGFDYLVRRPVHPEALRLLLLRCLYSGQERRSDPRVPVGYEVFFRAGLIQRRATMIELSRGGCGLVTSYALSSGRRIRVRIPEAVGAAQPLVLTARVKRQSFDESQGESGLYVVGAAFEDLDAEQRQELEWIVEERARGPACLADASPVHEDPRVELARKRRPDPRAEPEVPSLSVPAEELELPERFEEHEVGRLLLEDLLGSSLEVSVSLEGGDDDFDPLGETAPTTCPPTGQEPGAGEGAPERRGARRSAYPRKVPAFGSRALRVLMGRDVSMRGMRVERSPGLEVGDRLHLAIYADAEDAEPFLLWATVDRDDGIDGIALRFDPPPAAVAERLEALVASLPSVEPLQGGECAAMGTVVGEILEA